MSDDWRPRADVPMLRRRARMLADARQFFAERDVLEVATPALAPHSVTDVHIASLESRIAGGTAPRYFLQTSPEFFMKRLLAANPLDICQIALVFRDGEIGANHQPVFTMAEWYRCGLSMTEMIEETLDFIVTLAGDSAPPERGYCRYRDCFREVLGIDPLTASLSELQSCATGASTELIRSFANDREACLDYLFGERITPSLPPDTLTVVSHFPADQAALARLDPQDNSVAERFEVFWGTRELANGYRELTDAREQRRRFELDRARRRERRLPDVEPDPRMIAALDAGLPECSGVAVGLDRLLMCASGADDIAQTVSFAIT